MQCLYILCWTCLRVAGVWLAHVKSHIHFKHRHFFWRNTIKSYDSYWLKTIVWWLHILLYLLRFKLCSVLRVYQSIDWFDFKRCWHSDHLKWFFLAIPSSNVHPTFWACLSIGWHNLVIHWGDATALEVVDITHWAGRLQFWHICLGLRWYRWKSKDDESNGYLNEWQTHQSEVTVLILTILAMVCKPLSLGFGLDVEPWNFWYQNGSFFVWLSYRQRMLKHKRRWFGWSESLGLVSNQTNSQPMMISVCTDDLNCF